VKAYGLIVFPLIGIFLSILTALVEFMYIGSISLLCGTECIK
jgi:hypothetical protein